MADTQELLVDLKFRETGNLAATTTNLAALQIAAQKTQATLGNIGTAATSGLATLQVAAQKAQASMAGLSISDKFCLGIGLAKDALGNLGDTARGQATRISNAFANAGDQIRAKFASLGADIQKGIGLGLGIGAVQLVSKGVQELTGFLKDSVSAAAAEEVGIRRLGASLKANVPAFDGNTEAIEKQITASQKLGFSDGDLRDSLAALAGATHDIGKAFQLQGLAMDLARFEGVSLATATDELIRVQAGSLRSLKGLGIELKAGTSATEAFGRIQAVVAGQAAAFGDTTAGAMAKADVAMDNLRETIGKVAAKPLADFFNAAADAIENRFIPDLELAGIGLDRLTHLGGPGGQGEPDFFERLGSAIADMNPFLKIGTTLTEQYKQQALDAAAAEKQLAQDVIAGSQSMDESTKSAHLGAQAYIEYETAEQRAAVSTATLHEEINKLRENQAKQNLATQAATDFEIEQAIAKSRAADALKKYDTQAGEDIDWMHRQAQAARDLAGDYRGLTVSAAMAAGAIFAGANRGQNMPGSGASKPSGRTDPNALIDYLENIRQQGLRADQAAKDAADKALAQAKKDAAEYAQTLEGKLNKALAGAKDLATTLFDKLHERHLQAIADTEKLAEKQHDAATQAISDSLKASLARDAAPVTEAEKAQSAIELSRQNRDLHASLTAAQQTGDPEQIRRAQESLQSFQAAQHITYLKEEQARLDLAATKDAAAKQKTADDLLVAAKTAQANAITAETARNKKQVDDFERALSALKERDKGASPTKFRKDITDLETRFGITTDASGKHHIEDPLVTAIKNVKIPVPRLEFHATLVSPPIYLGARQIVAALASHQSPAATPGVRTGILTPARG